jgi:hypothetical protein
MGLRKEGIELCPCRNSRWLHWVAITDTEGGYRTVVTSGLQLTHARDSFHEQQSLIGAYDEIGMVGIWADYGRRWDLNALMLQSAARIVKAASHARIFLGQRQH